MDGILCLGLKINFVADTVNVSLGLLAWERREAWTDSSPRRDCEKEVCQALDDRDIGSIIRNCSESE